MYYQAPYAHTGAGRLTGIREQICKKEVESMLQGIMRKAKDTAEKKPLRYFPNSAFHKYLHISVKKNTLAYTYVNIQRHQSKNTSQLLFLSG